MIPHNKSESANDIILNDVNTEQEMKEEDQDKERLNDYPFLVGLVDYSFIIGPKNVNQVVPTHYYDNNSKG